MGLFFNSSSYKKVFDSEITLEEKLFVEYVKEVVIETSSFCNRKCDYCPLCFMDRKQNFMSDDLWEKIISELSGMKYKSQIVLNFYNEPLLDKSLPEKIKKSKK